MCASESVNLVISQVKSMSIGISLAFGDSILTSTALLISKSAIPSAVRYYSVLTSLLIAFVMRNATLLSWSELRSGTFILVLKLSLATPSFVNPAIFGSGFGFSFSSAA